MTIEEILQVDSFYSLSKEDAVKFRRWMNEEARSLIDSYEYCCLLGWMVLDDYSTPLSPKEAGLE
jgi:hypothetical protein